MPVTICGNAVDRARPTAAQRCGLGEAGADTDGDGLIDLVVPITVCGNAAGVGGEATAACSTDPGTAGLDTDDDGVIDATIPVVVCGNAVAALADGATATCSDEVRRPPASTVMATGSWT